MNSNTDGDDHNSRSNSLKSECGGMDCDVSGIPYGSALRSPSGPAQQIHTSHEGRHMVAAQHMESQVALYLIASLPPPKDGLLSIFFPPSVAHLPHVTNQTGFFCSHLHFDLPWRFHIAYLCVHSLADLLYLSLSALYV